MKKISISLTALFVAMTTQAQVIMYDNHEIPSTHNSGIPIVDSDGNEVTIKSDSTIYNADIVIKDKSGNVMHHSVETLGPMGTTIFVPDNYGISEKATIDIYYDRRHINGYFNE